MTNDSYNSISSMGDHSADKSAVLKKANELLTMGEIEFAWKQVAEFCLNNSRDPEMLAMLRELERVRMRKEPSGTKISFIQIVLNGMPFMEYVLKSIYRYAHEIIIVEGAVENCMFAANPDGSSRDGTVEFVRSFPDPDNKIRFIQGKWPEKLEMTNEAIRHVTGDYVWIIDSDEIYRDEDIEKIIEILKADPSITQIGMIPYNFWKGFDYYVESDRFTEHGLQFQGPMKFLKGARFINHRPVQLKYPGYLLTADYLNRIDGTETKAAGIRFCHYSYILESQVYQKIELYHRYGWGKSWHIDLEKWYNECFLKWTPENRKQIEAEYPVWTGDTNSHTVPFTGEHPKVIQDFIAKFRAGEYKPVITQNQCEDNNSKLSDNTATVNTSHQILDQVRNFSEATSMEKLRQGNVVVQIDSAEFTLKKLGTDSGGWVVPVNIISEDAICYCVGAGRDISFDVSLVTEYGCDVHIFDPAPTAQARVSTLKDATYKGMKIGIADSETEFYEVNADQLDKIKFLPYGILSRSETRTFYRTSHNEHISYSIFDTNNTSDRFDAECFNLTDVTERLGHRKIDLLKLNVKGAEYEIVDSIINNDISVGILCLEFDQLNNMSDDNFKRRTKQYIGKLLDADFIPLFIDGSHLSSYTFIHADQIRYKSCQVSKEDKTLNPIEEIFRRPKYIKTETTNICNANCSFCAYDIMTRPKGVMSMELFRNVIDQYAAMGGGQVTISPEVGDCLIDANLIERLRYCRQYDQIDKLGFHTNMIGLNRWTDEQILEIIELVTWWACSIGPNREVYKDMFGVDQFERVIANLDKLRMLLGRSRNKPDLALNGRACGGAFKVDERLVQLAYDLIGKPVKWMRVYGDWGGTLGTLPRSTPIDRAGHESEKRFPCMKPLVSAVIFYDGRVGFCGCADYNAQLIIGDINREPLESILSGRKRREYLESFGTPQLNDYCRKCTFYEPLQSDLIPEWIRHKTNSASSLRVDDHEVQEPIEKESDIEKNLVLNSNCTEANRFWPEDKTLPVVGHPTYQKMVLDSWKYIELDEPLQKRSALIDQNVERRTPFWNNHVALSFLASNLNPDSYLEIGVRSGGSLIPTVHNSDIKTVVGIDIWKGSYGGVPNSMEYAEEQIREYKERTGKKFNVQFFKGDSHVILKTLIASGRKFDLITVDGDHFEQGAWEDLNDASLLLAERGAIVFDDIIHPSHEYLMSIAERYSREHPEYRVLINSKQDNGCVVFLKGIDPVTLLSCGRNRIADGIADSERRDVFQRADNTDYKLSSKDSVFGLHKCVKSEEAVSTENYQDNRTTADFARAEPEVCMQNMEVKNLLWIRTDSIGDNILASSMLPHIRQNYPNAKITVLCQEHIAELYEVCSHIDDIVTFNRIRALDDEKYRRQIIERLRSVSYDLCLNSVFSSEPLTDIFSIGSLANQRIAFDGDLCNIVVEARQMYNRYYTKLLPGKTKFKPELQRHMDFLSGIGIEVENLEPIVWTDAQDEEFASDFFDKNNLDSERTVALFPSAQHFHKVYESYDRVFEGLKSMGLSYIILGGKDIEAMECSDSLRSKIPGISYDLIGKTTIRQMVAIIRRCGLYLGSDSAGAHIACAVDTPNIVLLGGGHFARFFPYSPLTSVVCLPLECYECLWACHYERPHCIKDIAPEVVVEVVHRTLEERSDRPRVFMQDSSLWDRKLGRPEWQSCDKRLNFYNVEIVRVDAESKCRANPAKPTEYIIEPDSCTCGDKSQSLSSPGSLGSCNRLPSDYKPPMIATSIAPRNIDVQKNAVESWLKLGFNVTSVNHKSEIEFLRPSFPRVNFIQTERSAKNRFGRPFVYLDDVFDCLRRSDSDICGIVNSDIILSGDESIIRFIGDCAKDSLVYGPRIDVESSDRLSGETYTKGFDFFFFPKSVISSFPRSVFCLGLPWWDYWFPLVSTLNGVCIKRLDTPFAYHIKHDANWDREHWELLAKDFFAFLRSGIEENYHSDPDTNSWSLLGRMFATYHDYYLKTKNITDRTKMALGVIPPCILRFLDTKSIKIHHENYSASSSAKVSFEQQGDTATVLDVSQEQVDVSSSNDVDVSIIVCTKNRAQLLDQMLLSLGKATEGINCEVIAIEGGADDNTMEVLQKHNVKNIYHESECLGEGRHSWPQLYNFGFSKANGKWAMYASDDILFSRGCIEQAVNFLNKQKDQVAGGIFFYRNFNTADPQWLDYGIDFTQGSKLLMNYGLVRLNHFREVGGLDEAYQFYCADSDLCYKLYEHSKQLIPLPDCFIDHNNVLDAQKNNNMADANNDIQRMFDRWKHRITPDLPHPRRLIWKEENRDAFNLPMELDQITTGIEKYWHALAYLGYGFFEEARNEFILATSLGCKHWRVWWYLAKAVRKCRDSTLPEEYGAYIY